MTKATCRATEKRSRSEKSTNWGGAVNDAAPADKNASRSNS